MDIGKTIFDVGLQCWDCMGKYLVYIRSLEDNLSALRRKKDELKNLFEDVNRRVVLAEGERKVRTKEVEVWLEKVQALLQELDRILQKGELEVQNNCLCGLCPKNCRQRYKQSKNAEATRSLVEEELVQGHNFKDDIAYEPADLVLERSREALRVKMDELGSIFKDVSRQAEEGEDRNIKPTSELVSWLERVARLKEEVEQVLEKGDQETKRIPRNYVSCYELSKLSDEKKAAVQEELVKGHLFSAAGIALEAAGTAVDAANLVLMPFLKAFIGLAAEQQHGNGQSQLKSPEGSTTEVPDKDAVKAVKAKQ